MAQDRERVKVREPTQREGRGLCKDRPFGRWGRPGVAYDGPLDPRGRDRRGPKEAERYGHRGYSVAVGRVGGGRCARRLGCGRSGPVRPSAAWAVGALREDP